MLCVLGIRSGFNERVWQFLRSLGLGDHSLGVLFVWIPISVLAAEWIVSVGRSRLLFVAIRETEGKRMKPCGRVVSVSDRAW